ncbi:hypothetical protein GSI_08531 [Ganoderma sinense ZZ0214-1]|uniref:Uncharacterized protein n=1 Tax=Ganoderma sinense ZZ0214-1 TaxID=1077348 RepID=A0A2G8S3Y1_9APHY|nr:hypothetical protein GSI_08531 [Ganoderma sinense ZZ0214-1]
MSAVSRLPFIPFTPSNYADLQHNRYHSDRDSYRGELRLGLNTNLFQATGVEGIQVPYSKEKYARVLVWCLGVLLDGWPWHIPFTNLSDIKGGAAPLRLLTDLLRAGTLRFIPAPQHVRRRALHDPDSVLPHVMAAARLPPLPRTIQPLEFSLERFRDLIAPRGPPASLSPARLPAPAEERVLHPDNLEPVLTSSIGPGSPCTAPERRQRCDTNRARHRPVSNPEGKPLRARKIGVLTSQFVLDRPAAGPGPSTAPASRGRPVKPLSEHRLPLMVNDDLGRYVTPGGDASEVEEIDSESESEDEREGGHQAKRRRVM